MDSTITNWVKAASVERKEFRQAVHVVLYAIAQNTYLNAHMTMKGGMLLGLKYGSDRFTEDIDFSTNLLQSEISKELFLNNFEEALLIASDELTYDLKCVLQSYKIQPKNGGNFSSYFLSIGYGKKSNKTTLERLEKKQCPTTVKIDYSFNEKSFEPEKIIIDDEDFLQTYGLKDIIAEKLRSIIQQVIRNRNRRQDIYDLWFLLNNYGNFNELEKIKILNILKEKSVDRIPKDFLLDKNTLRRSDIKKRSQHEYEFLADEIQGKLPDFETAYSTVLNFYESLPWE